MKVGGVSIETRGKTNAGDTQFETVRKLGELKFGSVLAHLCALNRCGCLRQPNIAALNKKDKNGK